MPAAAERERPERARADPLGDLQRGEHADRTGEVRPRRIERQEQDFEIDRFAGAVAAGRPGDRADALVGEDRKQAGDYGPAVGRPEAQKRFAFEFAVEQRTNPRAGEPDRVPVCRFERKDEGIAERAANGAWFDLGTSGAARRPRCLSQ